MKLLIMQSSPASFHFLLGPGKIMVLYILILRF